MLPRVLVVTGAAGFIGGRFALQARERGIQVIAVDEPAAFDTRVELRGVSFAAHLSPEQLLAEWNHLEPAAVVHLGAITNTMEFDERKLRAANTEYSQELWNRCAAAKIPFVYASSAATYGAGDSGYSDTETDLKTLKPLNPYGDSKQLFDLWALAQEREGHAPPAWSGFKFFNVYGWGEAHKGRMASVVWHALQEIHKTGKVTLFRSHRAGIADGEQKRDFVSVEDVTSVLWFALGQPSGHPLPRGIYNLGSGQARSFLDLARGVFAALGREPRIEFVDTPVSIRDKYQYFTQAEMSKLRDAGYTPAFSSLEAGIRDAVKKWEHPPHFSKT